MIRSTLWLTAASLILASTVLAGDPPAGEVIFKANKCTMCHKLTPPEPGVEINAAAPPNLQFVGDRHNAEWMSKFLMKEIDNEGRKHKALFKGKPEELKTLTEWLAGLKAPAKDSTTVEPGKSEPAADPTGK